MSIVWNFLEATQKNPWRQYTLLIICTCILCLKKYIYICILWFIYTKYINILWISEIYIYIDIWKRRFQLWTSFPVSCRAPKPSKSTPSSGLMWHVNGFSTSCGAVHHFFFSENGWNLKMILEFSTLIPCFRVPSSRSSLRSSKVTLRRSISITGLPLPANCFGLHGIWRVWIWI